MKIKDSDSGPGQRVPDPTGTARPGLLKSWESLMLDQWPNSRGIMAWVLYSLGRTLLTSNDQDSVVEIISILRPYDANLAALLSAKVRRQTRRPG